MSFESEKPKTAVNAIMIIEVMGRPPEHLTTTLNELIEKISQEKGVKITEKKLNEPVLLKDQKDFYSSYAEIEVEVEEINLLSQLMFKYMPAHVEIVYPENINLSNNDLNDMLNEITRRLHMYDEVARTIQMEKQILENKLKALVPKK